jgi:phenylacetic acid degradation operon negative regulatory protein
MGRGDSAGVNEPESDALAGAVARSGAPPRVWSLAVSFLGDCIVPRGGEVGMATITEVLAAFGIDPGAARTAMSRLANDGWVTRQKVGRLSFYALTPVALAESEAASRRIYAARHPQAACSWRVYLGRGLPKPDQARLRARLGRRGAADFGGHVYLVPAGEDSPEPGQAIALMADPLPEAEARRLVERAFDLRALDADYARFAAAFAPVRESLETGRKPVGLEAVAMRVFVIHCFRRIVLRDPLIPAPYLPADWPGIAARDIAGAIWRALFRASEAWLDSNAASAYGPLPPRSVPRQKF